MKSVDRQLATLAQAAARHRDRVMARYGAHSIQARAAQRAVDRINRACAD